jgi:carbonic anhydrase
MSTHHTNPDAPTADEALARLIAGNERFVRGKALFQTAPRELLAELAKGQRPYATIIGCSDSRVPPELVFDVGFGELFVIRVAGNVIGPAVMGSIQYAAVHLKTPLFVVMGHEGCGAVEAALAAKNEGAQQPSRIALLSTDRARPRAIDRRRRGRADGGGGRSQRALVDPPDARHA